MVYSFQSRPNQDLTFIHTNEIKQERDQYVLKLTNLPPGTTGYDLKYVIDNCKARTCYIPRTQNYHRKRFAILNFKDAETQERARDNPLELGTTILNWHEMNNKLCAICNSADHLAAQCEIKEKMSEKRQQTKEKT